MAHEPDRELDGPAALVRLRHGCWLVVAIAGLSFVALIVVGLFGLVGERELALVVVAVAALVVSADRRSRRRSVRRTGGDRR